MEEMIRQEWDDERKKYEGVVRRRVEAHEEMLRKEKKKEQERFKKPRDPRCLLMMDNEYIRGRNKEMEESKKGQEEELEKAKEDFSRSWKWLQLYLDEVKKTRKVEERVKSIGEELEQVKKEKEEAKEEFSKILDEKEEEFRKILDEKDAEKEAAISLLLDYTSASHHNECSITSHEPPSCFICPISTDVMREPHFAADGFTYEAEAIKEWFDRGHETSPMTNLRLAHKNLVPNKALRSAIRKWLRRYPSYFICPLSKEIMREPHFAADGFTYEAEAIKGWFDKGRDISPVTDLSLPDKNLVPNLALRSAIQEWLTQNS